MKSNFAFLKPYIRVSDEDKQMDQDTYDDMLRERDDKSKAWENQVSKYGITDIDKDVFTRYLKRARKVGRITIEEDEPSVVLKKLELLEGDRLLNAGAALFVSSGMNDLQMAKFQTNERNGFADIDRKTGSILELVEVAMQYLVDAMDWRVEINGSIQRNEIPEVPVDALREAVVNAFAHRLIESGETVQIMVFRNRIEIYSPGAFPEKVTPEDFMSGKEKAIRRNKLISRTLYYSKDMESFATGLKNVKDLCNEAGVRFSFERSVYGFTVVFYRHCGEGWGWTADDGENENETKSAENKGKNVYLPNGGEINGGINGEINGEITLSEIEQMIFNAIIENPKLTRPDMAEKLNIGTSTIDRSVKKLKKEGYIERIGSNKTGYWEVLRRE